MIKRIIPFITACVLALSVVCFPVSAESNDVSDIKNACGQYFSLLDDYLRGDITYEAFHDKTTALLHDVPDKGKDTFTKLVNGLTNAAEGISYGVSNGTADFVKVFRDFGNGLTDFYNDFYDGVISPISDIFDPLWNKFCKDNGYVKSDFDMQGYGAAFLRIDSEGKLLNKVCGDYGVFKDNTPFIYAENHGYTYSFITGEGTFTDWIQAAVTINDPDFYFYGDWRYEDGTSADDLTTPNDSAPITPDDIDSNTDLSDFLEQLLEKLKGLFPDLSTIEGLLQSIYDRLGTLDNDNDNDLLSDILSAIELLKVDSELDTEEKEKISEELTDIAENMISSEDFKVDSDLVGQRFDLVKLAIENKFSFANDIKKLIDYSFSCYKSSNNVPKIPIKFSGLTYYLDFSAFDENINLIRFVIAAFVYITYAIHTYRKIPSYINGGDNE